MSTSLTRIVHWGHQLLAEKIKKKQLTVDLTAGNGYDALMLWQLVGAEGQVIAFDIQQSALDSTREKLEAAGAIVRLWKDQNANVLQQPGVDLVFGGHENLNRYLPCAPQAIVANLGYFPGGDKELTTQPETTLQALEQSCHALAVGGRIAVVVYVGHPGGKEEGQAVDAFFAGLNEDEFQVLRIDAANRQEAPYLLVAEKQKGTCYNAIFG